MSLSIAAFGTVPSILAPQGATAYAQNAETSASASATTLAAESGAAAVVYEPGAYDEGQDLTYSNPDRSGHLPVPVADAADSAADAETAPPTATGPAALPSNTSHDVGFAGDEAVVAATGGTVLPPPQLPETPHSAAVAHFLHDVWAPIVPTAPGQGSVAVSAPPVQAGQAEAHAQASYAAVADAMVVGASLADLPKFA